MMSEELERILVRLTEPDNAVIQQVDTYMNTVTLQNSRYGIYGLILIIWVGGRFQRVSVMNSVI